MLFTRKIGKFIRGKANPFQVMSACILGALIGGTFPHWPGIGLLFIVCLICINANLMVSAFVSMLTVLFSLAILAPAMTIGTHLVGEGKPLEDLGILLCDTPVIALLGVDTFTVYAMVPICAFFGTLIGVIAIKALTNFRKCMVQLEASDGKLKKISENKLFKFITWVFFGKKAKKNYSELLESSKIGLPIRPLGVVFMVLFVGLAFITLQLTKTEIAKSLAIRALEKINGAEVTAEQIDIDLQNGRIVFHKLAFADAGSGNEQNLTYTNLLEIELLEGDIALDELLKGRIYFDKLSADDNINLMQKRNTPAIVFVPAVEQEPAPENAENPTDWLYQAEKWRKHLARAHQWIEKIEWPGDKNTGTDNNTQDQQNWRDILAEEAAIHGYAHVKASNLLQSTPAFEIGRLELLGIEADWPDEEEINIVGDHISTEAKLARGQPRMHITSSNQTLDLDLLPRGGPTPNASTILNLSIQEQALNTLISDDLLLLRSDDYRIDFTQSSFSLDLEKAALNSRNMAFPLIANLTGITAIADEQTYHFDNLPIDLQIIGDLRSPAVIFNKAAFYNSLTEQGGKALASQMLRNYLGDELSDEQRAMLEQLDLDLLNNLDVDNIGNALGNLLGGDNNSNSDEEGEDNQVGELLEGINGLF